MTVIRTEDEMTPLERMDAYSSGEKVDRLPFESMMSEDAALYIGKTCPDYLFDSDVMLETERFKAEVLRFESVGVSLGLRGVGECLGSEFEYPKDRIFHVTKPILTDYSMLDHMDPLNPYKDGRAPIILEGVAKCKEVFDGYCSVGGSVPGPISAAHAVRGETQLLKDIIKDPDNFERLMDFMVENCLIFAESNYKKNGVVMSIADPMSSTVLISPKTFEKRVFPYLEKLVDGIYKITGSKPSIHICGETKGIWPLVKKLNVSVFSIDNLEDIGEAKDFFGDEMMIMGNVDPVNTIAHGTIEDIYNETKACIEKGYDSPKGYIPASGCDIPPSAPIDNIVALTEATKKYSAGFRLGGR